MNVAIVAHQFFPMYYTGVERLSLNLARQLRLMGHRPVIVTSSEYSSDDEDRYDVEGVRVRPVRTGRLDVAHQWLHEPEVGDRVERVLVEEETELVHVMHPMRHACAFDVAAGLRLPLVAHIADFSYLCARVALRRVDDTLCRSADTGHACETVCGIGAGRERFAWAQETLARADKVVCPCRYTRDVFASQGFATERWRVVPWGVDYGIHQRRLPPPGGQRLVVGFLGTLLPHKGVHVLVEALRLLPDLPVELRVHGGAFHESGYERKVRKLARGDARISFLGSYDHARFAEVLAPLDLVAIPSLWYENLPTTGLNAIASGVPLVVSAVGGLEELVLDYSCGYTFPVGDAASLGALLARLALERDELATLRRGLKYPPSLEEEARLIELTYEEAVTAVHA